MLLTEKVAYIKGIIDGMNFDTSTNEGKIISLIVDLLDDISNDLNDLAEENATLNSYVEEIDEDLGTLEEVVYEEFDDCDCDCDCDDCDCDCDDCECDDDCACCDKNIAYDFFKVICPNCNEEVYLDNSIDPSQVICPACHKEFSVIENN
ncbi:MAG: hypothetical protein E7582_02680 [Ruminococcaceae bacterium]|nr:hypothetical protein [Oscillospiraceae bacterium]